MSAASFAPFDVLCTGLIVADHVAAPIPAMPPSGGLASTPQTELTIGGCGANVAVDLAKLGVAASLVGCVGDDVLGRFVHERLESSGVNCRRLIQSTTSQTATTLVVNVEGEDRRFIHAPGANTELTGLEITEELLSNCKIVYVGGLGMNPALSGDNVANMFRTARKLGVKTVLDVVVSDPAMMAKMLEPVLPVTDYFLPNTDEARLITGIGDPIKQANHFRQAGAQTTIVTCGGDGSVVNQQGGTSFRFPAYDVTQVDGTGGGDAFTAGLILGLLEGHEIRTCLEWGAAMGASCVQSPGATTGTFNRQQLLDFVTENPLDDDTF